MDRAFLRRQSGTPEYNAGANVSRTTDFLPPNRRLPKDRLPANRVRKSDRRIPRRKRTLDNFWPPPERNNTKSGALLSVQRGRCNLPLQGSRLASRSNARRLVAIREERP